MTVEVNQNDASLESILLCFNNYKYIVECFTIILSSSYGLFSKGAQKQDYLTVKKKKLVSYIMYMKMTCPTPV